MTPAEAVAQDCAELATLAPLLTPALRRDQTGGGRYGRLEATLSLFNTDVLLARNRLMYEIPAAAIRSATLVHETWPWRPVGTCLTALPRFAARMHALAMPVEVRQLEALTGSWRRQTKRALGLRTADLRVPVPGAQGWARCPLCETVPAGDLYLAGREAKLNPHDLTAPPKWDEGEWVIYCTAELGDDEDPHQWRWGRGEWGLLEQQIAAQHAEPASLANHGPLMP